jgi:hypothetical protein
MVIKVTFDTNVFTRFIDLKEGSDKIYYEKILAAIKSETIRGYFSDTFVTLEGVMRNQRVEIFGSRKISSFSSSSKSPNTINITIGASMCKPDLHENHLRTITSLLELGLRGLRGQAYLGDNFSVPSNMDIYESIIIDKLVKFREKMGKVEIAIGNKNQETGKNISKCRARELGLRWLKRDRRDGEIWYQGLGLCKDECESKQVIEAIAEWADGESIIRHIGYGNNYFCTLDEGKSTKGASIFDSDHREWLACEFGVKFVTPKELVEVISAM